jgi:hypothetical protein
MLHAVECEIDTPAVSDPDPGWGKCRNDITRDRTLPPHVKHVYSVLAGYADARRIAYPSQQTLAADTGLSERAVRKAIRQGADCGLWTVMHTQGVNRYQLHDYAGDRYVAGTGPLAAPELDQVETVPDETPTGTVCRPNRHVVPVRPAPCADEQDQRTRPENKTSSTSSDACQRGSTSKLADAPAQRAAKPLKIFRPRSLDQWDDGQAMRQIVASAVAALRAAGHQPTRRCPDAIGEMFRRNLEQGRDRAGIVDFIEQEINLAAGGDPDYRWMIDWDRTPASAS